MHMTFQQDYTEIVKRKGLLILVLLVVFAGVVLAVRFLIGGNEDTWICVNEQWVRHGHPKNPPPQNRCGNGGIKEAARGQRPGEFSNGQQYLTFKTNDFEVKYPNWPNIDTNKTPGTDKFRVAVANEGCNFIIKVSIVPPNTTLKAYAEKVISDSGTSIKINKKEINGDRAYLDGDVIMGGVTLKNVSLEFKTNNNIYGLAFVAEKNKFSQVCEPLVNEVNNSVKVN